MTALVLLFALWLVSPYFRHRRQGRRRRQDRRATGCSSGLMIMIGFIGKTLWDVLSPQGLAKKVSSAKAVALIGPGHPHDGLRRLHRGPGRRLLPGLVKRRRRLHQLRLTRT
ncbi:MAG: hypothetical protein MZU79_07215 [Anaerotruncus sp.]|nr:hypothetical protein [Anaerotruncus sp.]